MLFYTPVLALYDTRTNLNLFAKLSCPICRPLQLSSFQRALKRSMRPGFAGIDNDLFYDPRTIMLFGDARESLAKLVAAVKEA